jgi:hypothetical protein
MCRSCRLPLFWLALALVPTAADAQGTKPVKLDEATLRSRCLAAQFIEGKFTKVDVDGDEKALVLTCTHENKKVNAKGYQRYVAAAQRFNAALGIRSTALADLRKLKAAADQALKDAYDVETIRVNFDLGVDDKTPTRTMKVPTDDSGRPKKLSQAEMRKLKGDPKLPGLQARLADLDKEATVRVYLDKTKIKPGAAKTDDPVVYAVKMIVIQAPPAPPKPEDEFRPILLR